ncbi:MAG: PEP-CTERM sorting domain-containing protein [Phycisphaerales bacterium]
MRKEIIMTVAAGLLTGLVGATAQADPIVFQDNFGNGVPANSDGVPATGTGFWTVVQANNGTGGSTSVDENNLNPGKLTVTVTDAGTAAARPNVTLGSAVSPDFNFSTVKHTYSGTLALNTNGGAQNWNLVFRMMINKSVNSSYTDSDAVTLEITGQGAVSFGWKNGLPNSQPFAKKPVNSVTPAIGTITGYALSLDATNYELTVYGSGGTGGTSSTWTNTYASAGGLTHWGNSSLNLYLVENDGSGPPFAARTYTSTIDQVQVTAIPEPATLGLMALGGLLMLSRVGR